MISSTATYPSGISSGGSDAAVTAIPAAAPFFQVDLVNDGTAPGWYSIDGGIVWCRLPAGAVATLGPLPRPIGGGAILVKRVAGGADISGVYVSAIT